MITGVEFDTEIFLSETQFYQQNAPRHCLLKVMNICWFEIWFFMSPTLLWSSPSTYNSMHLGLVNFTICLLHLAWHASYNTNRGRLSNTHLRSMGPVAGQTITVKVKCNLQWSVDNFYYLVHFKTKMVANPGHNNSIIVYLLSRNCSNAPTKTLWKHQDRWKCITYPSDTV